MTDSEDSAMLRQPMLAHLLELRTRLIQCMWAIGLAFVVCYYFAGDIIGLQ